MKGRIAVLVGLALALGLGFFLNAGPAVAKPPVSWTPSSLEETVVAGERVTVPVSFTASKDLTDVVVWVVPELADLFAVSPEVLGDVQRGETRQLDLVILPASTTEPQTLDGVLQLRRGGQPSRVYSRPLPIGLEIVWPTVSLGGIAFRHPASWEAEIFPGEQEDEPTVILTSPSGSRIVVLPEGGFSYGFDPTVERIDTSLVIDGLPALRGDYLRPDGSVNVSRIVLGPLFPGRPDFRIDLRPNPEDLTAEDLFDEILESFELQ